MVVRIGEQEKWTSQRSLPYRPWCSLRRSLRSRPLRSPSTHLDRVFTYGESGELGGVDVGDVVGLSGEDAVRSSALVGERVAA